MRKQSSDENLAFSKMNSKSSLSNNLRFGPHDIVVNKFVVEFYSDNAIASIITRVDWILQPKLYFLL
jgi:hypothetical protein